MQRIEPLLPQGPIAAEPLVNVSQRLRTQLIDAALCVLPDLDQARFAQDAQMPRHSRAGYGQKRCQLPRCCRPGDKALEQRPAAGIRKCLKYRLHEDDRNRSVTYTSSYRGLATRARTMTE